MDPWCGKAGGVRREDPTFEAQRCPRCSWQQFQEKQRRGGKHHLFRTLDSRQVCRSSGLSLSFTFAGRLVGWSASLSSFPRICLSSFVLISLRVSLPTFLFLCPFPSYFGLPSFSLSPQSSCSSGRCSFTVAHAAVKPAESGERPRYLRSSAVGAAIGSSFRKSGGEWRAPSIPYAR